MILSYIISITIQIYTRITQWTNDIHRFSVHVVFVLGHSIITTNSYGVGRQHSFVVCVHSL